MSNIDIINELAEGNEDLLEQLIEAFTDTTERVGK